MMSIVEVEVEIGRPRGEIGRKAKVEVKYGGVLEI